MLLKDNEKKDRIKEILIIASLFIGIAAVVLRHYTPFDYEKITDDTSDYIVCAILFAVAFLSAKKLYTTISVRIILLFLYICTGSFAIIASFLHPMGPSYRAWVFIMILGYGSVYYVWSRRADYEKLFMLFSYALLLYSIIMIVWCLSFPYVEDSSKYYSYAGDFGGEVFNNPNSVPQLLLPGLVGVLFIFRQQIRNDAVYIRNDFLYTLNVKYELDKNLNKKSFVLECLSAIIIGSLVLFIIISHSRNGYLILCLLSIVLIIDFFVDGLHKKFDKYMWTKLACFMIVALLSAFFSYYIVTDMKQEYINEIPQYSEEEAYNDYLSNEKLIQFYKEMDKIDSEFLNNDKLSCVNQMLGRRLSIWIWYGRKLELMGSDKPFLNELSPHNQYIELSFRAGVVAGCCWFLFVLICFVVSLVEFIKRKPWAVFSMTTLIVFICESMLDIGVFPMDRLYIFVAYFAFAPLIFKEGKI